MFKTSRFRGGVAAVAVALLLGAAAVRDAAAGFIFTSQTRSVTGSLSGALGAVGPQTITAPPAPDFSVFDGTVNLTHPTYGGSAFAHQRSELLPLAITVAGQTGASRPAMVGTGIASASSSTSVSFNLVDAATEVTLSASGTCFNNLSTPFHSIRLTGPTGTTPYLVDWNSFNSAGFPATSGSRSTALTLGPGTYTFSVGMSSYNDSHMSHGVSNFNVALAIPEPASLMSPLGVSGLALSRRRRRRRD
jgi:hypothetical protein